MKIILIILVFFELSFAVQSIDLAGQLPPNTTLITENGSNKNLFIYDLGDVDGDGKIDIIARSFGAKIYFFLQNLSPATLPLTVADADFVLTKLSVDFLDIKIKDVNSDNISDIIAFGQSKNKIWIIFGGNNLNSLTGLVSVDSIADVVILKNNSLDSSLGFGDSIDIGDANGDLINDLLVSTFGSSGRAYLFYGSSAWQDTIDLNFEVPDALFYSNDNYSKNVFLKDVNNDNIADIFLSEYSSSNLNGNYTGIVSIFYGSSNLPQVLNFSDKNKFISGADNNQTFGCYVETANFSSLTEKKLFLGEGEYQLNTHNIFSFPFQNLNTDTIDLNQVTIPISFNPEFGIASWIRDLFFFKDLNNDQYDDLIIGDLLADDSKGKSYIFLGGNPNLGGQVLLSNQTADFVVLGTKSGEGAIVRNISDLNGDNFLDVVISIPGYDTPTANGAGAVMIVWGSAAGFDNDPIANAGEDLSGFVDSLVTLDGTSSYDIDGDSLSFLWTQISGTSVTLQTPTQPLCSFVNNGLVGEFLTFVLEISSNAFVSTDTVRVLVLPTNLSENTNKIKNFKLSQNYPNPFNPNTTISYEMPVSSGKLLIFNVKGEQVREFLLSKKSGLVVWNGTDFNGNQVSSGIYFYRLEVKNGFSETKKMVLLK